jgi:hypothetical protein
LHLSGKRCIGRSTASRCKPQREAARGDEDAGMNFRYHTGIACVVVCALALLTAGCNSDGSDRVPEMAGQAKAQAEPGQPAASQPGTVNAPVPESVADAALSSKVESALKAEPDLHGTSIAVRTDEGVVTLSGSAKSPQLRSMAAEVALSIRGVKLVRNEIAFAHAT